MRPDFDWTTERKDKLREMWNSPLTYVEMGLKLIDEHGPIGPGSVQQQLLKMGLMRYGTMRIKVALARGKWTPERLEFAKEKWLLGWTATQIARELGEGISRNAVIGKIHRLGIKRDGELAEKIRYHHADPERGKRRRALKLMKKEPVVSVIMPPPANNDGITIMELKVSSCRAIIGLGFDKMARYCGMKSDNGKSFCPWHYSLYYHPPERRWR